MTKSQLSQHVVNLTKLTSNFRKLTGNLSKLEIPETFHRSRGAKLEEESSQPTTVFASQKPVSPIKKIRPYF
mgnify:CR=1 FL=1